ncbi:exo-beta-N-acetylmuramidase NamZ family protein [Fodinibius sp. AD559]|uniref:exo-beta-N-acetylmuramidase NamZ family protein n=1 Tax=Fodinibius sp. AD559 TaxID=3424179 RepID=UPI004046C9F5
MNQSKPTVKVGAHVLLDNHLNELEDKRVGLVMNPTARVEGSHMLDTLIARDINVTALFAPEHGFRGDIGAGETIEDGIDQSTGLPVFSLYGKTRTPTPEMLEKVDILLFDIQDVGARFYTYNATLGNIIEAAAAQDIPVWILDRPNPAGDLISGWMMQDEHQSFVGKYPIPMVHGMTLGELAKMMVGEQWIKNAGQATVRVIPMEGWNRSMEWPETGLEWIPPSPNLPSFYHAYVYLGTVLFEGTTMSEGRGTDDPFLRIGSPQTKLTTSHIAQLRRQFSGVNIERRSFTPKSIPGKASNPKFEGEQCHGIAIQVTNPDAFNPVALGAELLSTLRDATPEASLNDYMPKLSGIDNSFLQEQLKNDLYLKNWEKTAQDFKEQRKPYLLYE